LLSEASECELSDTAWGYEVKQQLSLGMNVEIYKSNSMGSHGIWD